MVEMFRTSHHFSIRYNPIQWFSGMHQSRSQSSSRALCLALNSAIHRSTGEQPIYLLTGRHTYFPVGSTNEAVFNDKLDFQELDFQSYNQHVRATFTPNVGQLVWCKEMVPRPIGPKWRGPTRFEKKLVPCLFEVQELDSGKVLRAHLNHCDLTTPQMNCLMQMATRDQMTQVTMKPIIWSPC